MRHFPSFTNTPPPPKTLEGKEWRKYSLEKERNYEQEQKQNMQRLYNWVVLWVITALGWAISLFMQT